MDGGGALIKFWPPGVCWDFCSLVFHLSKTFSAYHCIISISHYPSLWDLLFTFRPLHLMISLSFSTEMLSGLPTIERSLSIRHLML